MLDVSVLMRHLVEKHDATNVMVEGGGRTIGEMWGQGVIDELMVFVGAKVLGDGAGSSAMRLGQGAASIEKMQRARAVRLEAVERVGDDVMMRWVKAGR
ncbi:MAG: hypothetical protein CMJ49_02600 [Planctomycetaceae bacterium]|nr:hypothetical protein [Planctomycetaceae bacterium]